ncbi:Chaperone protein htpG [Roseomonas mucosa]|uniref:Chaperone protein HtpG n=1 Tax=Roseomonas mucosa TaxID=207340 RepID=A0A1S8D706_9PROT|nr:MULTISPECIES: molecular chaperone HtpG [Roseomonas]MCG7352040.1 molecular chaperone HtpG [Roseomonas mucosa]MCG7356552.1 molecular chaperone HtpG [Roseomonas mucosa]MDT8291361.1 molecular chaperone HtpG [Roseomonas mucosa]MDT8295122.1 molecular chaperone HtpG [Roseomonas mucosa]MDT8315735.1 molecular chaperone HtpG [Roseomonas mucosa]
MSETLERHEFGTEVGRLLDLVVHALYSDREIFLRELVANAADAVDRRRFEALTDSTLGLPAEARVRIVPDKAARTLTISDPGIGMSKAELAQHLGTIARSGTLAFTRSLAQAQATEKPSLIGQFGVGFYSAFMVAERVEVTSRRAGGEEAWCWASEGQGSYTLAPASRAEPGTDIVLHMKADAEEFLEPFRLQAVIRKWADHITIPITVAQDGKDEPANEGTALWRKPKSEVTEEQYTEFYRHVAHAFDQPWATLHWRAEGTLDYSALLFIPGMKPFQAVEGERESRLRLHVRRMFITDEAGLLPPWLRFVEGVVDTEDLPLNVSREMLQSTPVLARIRKAVTNRVLSDLKSRAKDEADYAKFWENFGPVLKEGAWEDAEHRKEVATLLRFRSSAVEGWTSLADYVARMKEGQEAIHFLLGDDPAALAHSPQLEGFRAKGVEVLLLSDGIDAFWPERLAEFEGKPIRSVTQGMVDLSKIAGAPEAGEASGEAADVAELLARLKEALKDEVGEVRATDRLVESAVVLAAPQYGPDLQMQRMLRRAGRGSGAGLPVLEINPRHPLIRRLAEGVATDTALAEKAGLLLDLARVQDGDTPRDPAGFARRVAAALAF